ncbi:hypothetical protein DESPIG_00502 [Desulfovibrio piger ATCC 29098]|uniref:Uncharacterized protein n=1 Tax=Desulfovibrio piger ATCC 29098 TaxID=411464 RepID=B6WR22_9BACT|nr:hypothetical protein DESPIG_00502 [Desulfovibrio piger ATCC 29098]
MENVIMLAAGQGEGKPRQDRTGGMRALTHAGRFLGGAGTGRLERGCPVWFPVSGQEKSPAGAGLQDDVPD